MPAVSGLKGREWLLNLSKEFPWAMVRLLCNDAGIYGLAGASSTYQMYPCILIEYTPDIKR